MKLIYHFFLVIAAFLSMEGIAWFSHKYIMHGLLWILHKDHHQKNPKRAWEWNDAFVVMFAIPAWLFIMYGMMDNYDYKFYIGIGVTMYGLAYFLVHEIIIHRRFFKGASSTNVYVTAMRKAHKVHHSYIEKHPGDNFGFVLFIPWHYFREAYHDYRSSKIASSGSKTSK